LIDENIEATILNLLVSGPDTTSKLINWSFFFLAHHPRVQKKMFEEIESFVGTSRLPNVDDRGL
jgi:cytochrome P450